MNEVNDPRVKVFCSFNGPDVFQSIQHAHQIGEPDPYDVEEIHGEARGIFERQLNRLTTPESSDCGCVILLQGESGSGKTHLMRALRDYVHLRGLGCFAYMQMTTSMIDYGKYVLLTVISTKFLGDQNKIQFWVMQLLLEISRWASKHPSSTLQAVLFFDEADIYLPAIGKPATKEPMEDLLKRARSAGIGLLLASQNPGDFDYKCRDNIQTWLVGRIQEKTSLSKMRPMFNDFSALEIESNLSGQETGEFHLLCQKKVDTLKADRSLMETVQLSESEILKLAKGEEELFRIISCPKCGAKYKVPLSNPSIKRVKGTCRKCNQKFSITI